MTRSGASVGESPPESWGVPRFSEDFPRDEALAALVTAFARGDYATVRRGAPELARTTTDEEVRRAALLLRERIEPDPAAKVLFLFAATLLLFLSGWWVIHDGPATSAGDRQTGQHP